jgi:hypothetical protein
MIMGYGVSYHVRGAHTGREIAALGVACVVLGTNHWWTTFAIVDARELTMAAVVRELRSAVMQIGNADDDGRVLGFYAPDGWTAELTANQGEGGELWPEDQKLLAELVRRDILTEAQRAALAAGLGQDPVTRDMWLMMSGVEQALEVPSLLSLPWECSAELVADLAPGVEIIAAARPAKAKKAKPQARAPSPPAAAVDRAVLALHVHYWAEIFQMNCWKLYNTYKKHLPAERRREVDQLIDLLGRSSWNPPPKELERMVEAILAATWHAADWNAAIRDPSLVDDEPTSPEQRAAWQRLLQVS